MTLFTCPLYKFSTSHALTTILVLLKPPEYLNFPLVAKNPLKLTEASVPEWDLFFTDSCKIPFNNISNQINQVQPILTHSFVCHFRFPRRGSTSLSSILLLLLLLVHAVVFISAVDGEEEGERLGCHRRKYSFRVTQTDQMGRTCRDVVSVKSCWGRCDSNEISDYKFPFKRSYHPVCVFSGRVASVATLRYCDPDVAPNTNQYHYMEATACKCQTCTSFDTSCEPPKEFHHSLGSKMDVVINSAIGGVAEDYMDYN